MVDKQEELLKPLKEKKKMTIDFSKYADGLVPAIIQMRKPMLY